MLRIPNRQNPPPPRFHTALSVPKVPTCEQLSLRMNTIKILKCYDCAAIFSASSCKYIQRSIFSSKRASFSSFSFMMPFRAV